MKKYQTLHPYHIVDKSPWPFLSSVCVFSLMIGAVAYMHFYIKGKTLFFMSLLALVYILSNWWRDIVREALEKKNIESRYIWKPLHLQPIFLDSDSIVDGTAEQIYLQSLCLPSGRRLSLSEVDEICENILISVGAI